MHYVLSATHNAQRGKVLHRRPAHHTDLRCAQRGGPLLLGGPSGSRRNPDRTAFAGAIVQANDRVGSGFGVDFDFEVRLHKSLEEVSAETKEEEEKVQES